MVITSVGVRVTGASSSTVAAAIASSSSCHTPPGARPTALRAAPSGWPPRWCCCELGSSSRSKKNSGTQFQNIRNGLTDQISVAAAEANAFFPYSDLVVSRRGRKRGAVQVQLKIDRRHYFDQSLQRQEEEEAREAEAEITCPVDCVREVRSYAEFERVLREAEQTNSLVVVDFYNTSCGSCKYILPQFIKLCKRGSGEEGLVQGERGEKGVQFIKHNVRDDYDDLTDLARFYSIRTVPMFSFFVDGTRVEQFPTRDRQKLEHSVQRLIGQHNL